MPPEALRTDPAGRQVFDHLTSLDDRLCEVALAIAKVLAPAFDARSGDAKDLTGMMGSGELEDLLRDGLGSLERDHLRSSRGARDDAEDDASTGGSWREAWTEKRIVAFSCFGGFSVFGSFGNFSSLGNFRSFGNFSSLGNFKSFGVRFAATAIRPVARCYRVACPWVL